MAPQPKAARKGAKKAAKPTAKKAAKSAKPSVKKTTKPPPAAPKRATTAPPKPDAVVTSARDARVLESGADMADEAPEGDRHGDVRPKSPRSKAAVAETLRHNKQAEHAHQDPRWTEPKMDSKWAKAKRDPRKEGGLSKDRQVRRLPGMTNWFRRAPKPKS